MPDGRRCSFSPGNPRACCCHCCCLSSGSGESGEGAPGTLWWVPLRCPGGAGRGLGAPAAPAGACSRAAAAPGVAHPWLGKGPKPRRGEGMGAGVGGVPLLSNTPTYPFASNSLHVVTDSGEEHSCALGAFVSGSPAGNRGVDPCKDPHPARGQCQGSARCECRCTPV